MRPRSAGGLGYPELVSIHSLGIQLIASRSVSSSISDALGIPRAVQTQPFSRSRDLPELIHFNNRGQWLSGSPELVLS